MVDDNPGVGYVFTEDKLRMFIYEIHTTPKPQKQTLLGRHGCYDPSKQTKKAIQWQISPNAPKEPLRGAIEVHLTFHMPIPKDIRGVERQKMVNNACKHIKRPDLDNLAYIVVNAMKGIIYHDDSQICRMVFEKVYSETPKTVIKVCEV